jgi:hypothetical protein
MTFFSEMSGRVTLNGMAVVGFGGAVSYAHFGMTWNCHDVLSCRSDAELWLVHGEAASQPTEIQRQDSLPT